MVGNVKIEARAAAVKRALKKLRASMSDMTPVLDSIGDKLVRTTKRRFYEGRGPTNRPWKRTKAARRENRRTLLKSGALRESIVSITGSDEVQIGSDLRYAKARQFPGRSKRDRQSKAKARPGAALFRRGQTGGRHLDGRYNPRPFAAAGGSVRSRKKKTGVFIPARPFLGISTKDRQVMRKIIRERAEGAWK